MKKQKCSNCDKNAKYYLQHYSHSSLWDMKHNEINSFENGDPEFVEYFCQECAEVEGII